MKISPFSKILILLILAVILCTVVLMGNREVIGGYVMYEPDGEYGQPEWMYFSTIKLGGLSVFRNAEIGLANISGYYFCKEIIGFQFDGLDADGNVYRDTWFRHTIWSTSSVSMEDCERGMK